jgi:polysaccharide export outer membrane protein
MRNLFRYLFLALTLCSSAFAQTSPSASASAAAAKSEAVLGVGDIVKITVFQNPDLTVDGARVSETNQINFPLRPQVTIQLGQIRSNVISILGQVSKPGRYPVETVGAKVSEMIAAAGGVVPGGPDVVTLVGTRNGRPIKLDIDLPTILQSGKTDLDIPVESGDIIYADKAPTAYMYGEVQRPGVFRIERGMTLMQALAQNGGLTPKGTQRGIKVSRRDAQGNVTLSDIGLNDPVQRDDVIYVKESLF